MRNVLVALLTAIGLFGARAPFTAPLPTLKMVAEFDLPGPGGKRQEREGKPLARMVVYDAVTGR